MKNIKYLLISIALIQTIGCAPANIKPLAPVEDDVKSTLTVYRVRAFSAGGAKCVAGIDGYDRFVLKNKQSATVNLPAGKHEIYVRKDTGEQPFSITINLEKGQSYCYKVFPNPNRLAGMLLGNLIFPGLTVGVHHTFLIEKTVCSEADLEEYTPVTVEYREP